MQVLSERPCWVVLRNITDVERYGLTVNCKGIRIVNINEITHKLLGNGIAIYNEYVVSGVGNGSATCGDQRRLSLGADTYERGR